MLLCQSSGFTKTFSIITPSENTSPSGPAAMVLSMFSTGRYPGLPVFGPVGVPMPIIYHQTVHRNNCGRFDAGGYGGEGACMGVGVRG